MINFPLAVPGMDPITTALDARLDRTHPCWPRRTRMLFRDLLCDRADVLPGLSASTEEFLKNWKPVGWRKEWA